MSQTFEGSIVGYLQRENEALRRENEALKLRSVVDAESVVLVLDMADTVPVLRVEGFDAVTMDMLGWTKATAQYKRARSIAEKYKQAVMA